MWQGLAGSMAPSLSGHSYCKGGFQGAISLTLASTPADLVLGAAWEVDGGREGTGPVFPGEHFGEVMSVCPLDCFPLNGAEAISQVNVNDGQVPKMPQSGLSLKGGAPVVQDVRSAWTLDPILVVLAHETPDFGGKVVHKAAGADFPDGVPCSNGSGGLLIRLLKEGQGRGGKPSTGRGEVAFAYSFNQLFDGLAEAFTRRPIAWGDTASLRRENMKHY